MVAVHLSIFLCENNGCVIQVCQIRVMTEFETITLTQDGAVDFKTITVFSRVHATLHPALSVRPSVGPSVRPSVTLYFFGVNRGFGSTAPAQMLH